MAPSQLFEIMCKEAFQPARIKKLNTQMTQLALNKKELFKGSKDLRDSDSSVCPRLFLFSVGQSLTNVGLVRLSPTL